MKRVQRGADKAKAAIDLGYRDTGPREAVVELLRDVFHLVRYWSLDGEVVREAAEQAVSEHEDDERDAEWTAADRPDMMRPKPAADGATCSACGGIHLTGECKA